MVTQEKIKEWVNLYLQHIEKITPEMHVRDEEGYKFQAVDTFRRNFNIDAEDFSTMLDQALTQNNLVAGNMYFPKKVLLLFANRREEKTRQALRNLFDDEQNIVQRINETENAFNDILAQLREQKEIEEKTDNTFMTLRFLSLLLSFKSPNKYNAIKPHEWNMFCKFIDESFRIPNKTSSGERYAILEPYIEELRSYIKNIPEIKKIKDQLTRGLDFEDSEFRWMAQDIIYVTARIIAGQQSTEEKQPIPQKDSTETEENSISEIGKMEFPLENYLENFIIKNWDGIDFGEKLTLYEDEDGPAGQQYPTDQGYIDILARDKEGNLVVIELKKGRSNQKVLGQILAYVGWVRNNLAEKGQKVRGIIIATDGNQALLDAVSTVSDFISVKYYRVKFNFEDPE